MDFLLASVNTIWKFKEGYDLNIEGPKYEKLMGFNITVISYELTLYIKRVN